MNLRAYQIFAAGGQYAEDPIWPELDFAALCRIALKDRIITQALIIQLARTDSRCCCFMKIGVSAAGRSCCQTCPRSLKGYPRGRNGGRWVSLNAWAWLRCAGTRAEPPGSSCGTPSGNHHEPTLAHPMGQLGPCCGAVMGQGWPEGPHSIFYSVFNSLMTNKRNQW